MTKYFTLTSKIATRLRNKIFNGMSTEVYGASGGRIAREDEFARVRSALAHLVRNVHYGPDVSLAEKFTRLKSAHERLTEAGVGELSKQKLTQIDRLMAQIMHLARELLNERFSAEDVTKFVALAKQGRGHFATEGYDPEEFVSEALVIIGEMITANFAAYEATLNHDHIV